MDQQTAMWIAAIGAGGAAIGALVGAIGAAVVERGRRIQADRHRFASDRRNVYARFIHESEAIHKAVSQYVLMLQVGAPDRAEIASKVPDHESVAITFNEIRLLGTDAVVMAAGNLLWNDLEIHRYTMYEMGEVAADWVRPLKRWDAFEADWRAALENFVEIARHELAVDPGTIIERVRGTMKRTKRGTRTIDGALGLALADRSSRDDAMVQLTHLEASHPERRDDIEAARRRLMRVPPPTADETAEIMAGIPVDSIPDLSGQE